MATSQAVRPNGLLKMCLLWELIVVDAVQEWSFWAGSPARPMKANGADIADASHCPAPLKGACLSKGVKAAHLEGPADCDSKGWFCRIRPDSDWHSGIWADPNFIYCNNTPGLSPVPPLDRFGTHGHCHAATHDYLYLALIEDHWLRGYAGTLHCCCDMGSLTGVVERCDVKKEHGAGEVHAGCGNVNADPLYSGAGTCWSVERFADPTKIPGWSPAGTTLVGHGVAGSSEVWLGHVGGHRGGLHTCYQAVLADPRCAKDYFTYIQEWNCGCKGSGPLSIRDNGLPAKYYRIQQSSSTTSAVLTSTATVTTTMSFAGRSIRSGDIIFLKTRSGTGNHMHVEGTTVRAGYSSKGAWQAITIETESGGEVRSGDVVYLKAHTNAHIDVHNEVVQARWEDVGGWQAMTIQKRNGNGIVMSDDIVCLRSLHTGKYIDVEADVVRARFDECGGWQAMRIETEPAGALFSGGGVHLLAHTGQRIEVEGGSVGARWSEGGLWQTFVIQNYGGRVIYSGDAVFLKAHTGALVHVQDTSVLALWPEYGIWQTFTIEKKQGGGPIMPGDSVFLRAHTGRLVEVQGAAVQARWYEEGDWQSIVVEKSAKRRLTQTESKQQGMNYITV